MTPQEESMLNDLIGRVEQTQLPEKDPEAEQLLNQRLARNPNALYILSQTVLVQKYALEQAKSQIDQLRPANASTRRSPPTPPAFSAACWVTVILLRPLPSPRPLRRRATAQPAYAQPPGRRRPAYGAPPQPGGSSSFLRTAATTAAGVAAGALAFQGVESLMHGFGHPARFRGRRILWRRCSPKRPSSTIITTMLAGRLAPRAT